MSRILYTLATFAGLILLPLTSIAGGCDTNYANMLTKVTLTNDTSAGIYCHFTLSNGVWVNSTENVITVPNEIFIQPNNSETLEACFNDNKQDMVNGNVECTTWYQDFSDKKNNNNIFKTGYLVSNSSFLHSCYGGLNYYGAGSCGGSEYQNTGGCSANGQYFSCTASNNSINLDGSSSAEQFWITPKLKSGATTPSFPIV